MLRVGLTGGIGSGKSTVAAELVRRGAVLIDSDVLAREVVAAGTPGLAAVVAEFGPEVRTPGGELDRPAMAALAFADDDVRARLTAIVHPLVRDRAAELTAAAPADAIVVQDVPLLVEGGMAPLFALVVVVHTDVEERVRRLVADRGMPEEAARARIAAQATDDARRAAADVVLDNGGSRADTVAAVGRLWDERLVPFADNLNAGRRAPRVQQPVLAAPDTTWVAQATRTIARVSAIAGSRALRVDHIGSTSVPGLIAKDVLDVQVVVADLDTAGVVADDLAGAGLVRLGGRWWDNLIDGTERDKAMVVNADPGRPVNCHVRAADSPAWRDTLLLRDWLRAHPDGVAQYARTKTELTGHTWADMDAYADAKTPFITDALRRGETWAAEVGWSVDG